MRTRYCRFGEYPSEPIMVKAWRWWVYKAPAPVCAPVLIGGILYAIAIYVTEKFLW